MSSHQMRSRTMYYTWMVACAIVLALLAAWILRPSASGVAADQSAATQYKISDTGPGAGPVIASAATLTKADVMGIKGIRFGLSAPQVPYSPSEISTIAGAAGVDPTMLMFFTKWNESFPSSAVTESYKENALPVLSWEPWAGQKAGVNQPAYSLAKIYGGNFDTYIKAFATAVRNAGVPIAIRFAHEMNGDWYPWSEKRSGNRAGDYVKAWRHVHDIFTAAGATNVIWIWSPNILRPVPNVSLKALYPGNAYVDWIGMVGYSVREHTAAETFDPTIRALDKFTSKPIVITETGAQPSSYKAAWISNFFSWLPRQPQVIGFNWFEFSKAQGGSADWRFMATSASQKAFHNGIAKIKLAPAPGPG